MVERDSDGAVGLVYLDRRPQPWIAGLGYWLIPSAQRRHLGMGAVRLASDWALRELDILRLEARVAPDNLASHRVLEHAGFLGKAGCATSSSSAAGQPMARVPPD